MVEESTELNEEIEVKIKGCAEEVFSYFTISIPENI